MGELDFGGGLVLPLTPATMLIWLLYTQPHRSLDIADILNVERNTAIMRIARAVDALPDDSLSEQLRAGIHWRGGVAAYVPVVRKM